MVVRWQDDDAEVMGGEDEGDGSRDQVIGVMVR